MMSGMRAPNKTQVSLNGAVSSGLHLGHEQNGADCALDVARNAPLKASAIPPVETKEHSSLCLASYLVLQFALPCFLS